MLLMIIQKLLVVSCWLLVKPRFLGVAQKLLVILAQAGIQLARLLTHNQQLTTNNSWPRLIVAGMLVISLVGCDWMPGKPRPENRWKSPEENLDFASLYANNCIACHAGPSGVSPSMGLANSIYLSLISPEKMREIIAHGVPGTAMPAFSEKKGGRLTEAQIDVLVKGIYGWKDAQKVPGGGESLPSYSASAGDASRGAQVFSTYCASCHGTDGAGGKAAGSVVDSAYLNLVTEQYLRTVTIAGRPELGHPNWRNAAGEGKSMSDQDIADVVAWLISHRGTGKGSLPAEMRR